jgi:hypothetical protein
VIIIMDYFLLCICKYKPKSKKLDSGFLDIFWKRFTGAFNVDTNFRCKVVIS